MVQEKNVVNPFVVVVATGEVGKIVSSTEGESTKVRFWDSPINSFEQTFKNDELKQYRPESNGLVWLPEVIETGTQTDALTQYVRGTWILERDSGHWGVKIRRSGEIPESKLLDPGELLIHRLGAKFNPTGAFRARLSMSSKYFVTRIRLLEKLYDQIQVSRGFRAILSSSVRPFLHQINTMVRVLSDPTPRFILADEVGLGKTIEAGLIIRQTLFDFPNSKVVILVPNFLVNQWRDELIEKLLLEEFIQDERIVIGDFGALSNFENCDLLVIDEAHQITKTAMSELFIRISNDLPVTSGLLLLTATPMRGNRVDFLRLLNLVDPSSYPIDEFEQFERRLALREESARDIEYLKIEGLPASALRECFQRIRSLFPLDQYCLNELSRIEMILDSGESALVERIKLSNYLRENYRISRRVIRNRRTEVMENGFKVTGRELTRGKPCEIEEKLRSEIDSLISLVLSEMLTLKNTNSIDSEVIKDFVTTFLEAGLSSPEVFLDEFQQTLFLNIKPFLSDYLVGEIDKVTSEIQSYGKSARWEKTLQICSEHVTYPNSGGVVVFARSTNVAKELSANLMNVHGAHNVRMHISTMSTSDQDEAVDHFLRHDGCRILIMDKSGEEGRNLQGASEVIHFSLPISPNQLEQRLGRSDRFSETLHHRASSTVFVEKDSVLIAGQFKFLEKGLNIFNRSVATAQHLLSLEFESLLDKLISQGLDAFTEDISDLADRLDNEIETIAYVDQLESISIAQEFSSDDFQKLVELDEVSSIDEAAIGLYVYDPMRSPPTAPIGLISGVSKYSRQDLTQTMRLSMGIERPAELRDLSSREKTELSRLIMKDNEYAFSRLVARSLSGVTLYRVGDPLVDWTIKWIETSELGRTWAVWRQIPKVPTTAVFSASIRLGLNYEVLSNFSEWGVATLRRRIEMAMPSQMFNLLAIGKNILNHDDEEVHRNIPKLGLSENNISGKNWKRVIEAIPNFDLRANEAAQSMIDYVRKSIKTTEDYRVRRSQELKTHEYVASIFELHKTNFDSESKELLLGRMAEESEIHELVISALDNPPCEVYSFGLIVMSREKL